MLCLLSYFIFHHCRIFLFGTCNFESNPRVSTNKTDFFRYILSSLFHPYLTFCLYWRKEKRGWSLFKVPFVEDCHYSICLVVFWRLHLQSCLYVNSHQVHLAQKFFLRSVLNNQRYLLSMWQPETMDKSWVKQEISNKTFGGNLGTLNLEVYVQVYL